MSRGLQGIADRAVTCYKEKDFSGAMAYEGELYRRLSGSSRRGEASELLRVAGLPTAMMERLLELHHESDHDHLRQVYEELERRFGSDEARLLAEEYQFPLDALPVSRV